MQCPKCVENLAVYCLTKNFAKDSGVLTPSRASSQGRARIGLMSDRLENCSRIFTGWTPCKRKLDFYYQEDDISKTLTTTTTKRRKECLEVLSLCLSVTKSNIRPRLDLFNKKVEEGTLFATGKLQFTAFTLMLFCAWETMIRMKRSKQKRFQLTQMARKKFIATLSGFSFMKQH